MSGGHFDYRDSAFVEIADEIERSIKHCQRVYDDSWEPTDKWLSVRKVYGKKVAQEFRKAVRQIRKAYVYAHRIDWLLSGDDGEDTFLRKLPTQLHNAMKRNWETER